jgi:hypothetical protein
MNCRICERMKQLADAIDGMDGVQLNASEIQLVVSALRTASKTHHSPSAASETDK